MTLIVIGSILLVGLVADITGRGTFLPRVTVLLLSGMLIGSAGLDLLPAAFVDAWFPPLTQFALAMVGFLLGQELTFDELRKHGRQVLVMTFAKVVGTACVVVLAMVLAGVPIPLALVLAGIATATAPAATVDVVHELEERGLFARLLLKIVAFDDALGLVVFAFLLAAASSINGAGVSTFGEAGFEVLGSLVLGGLIGIPMAFMTGRISEGTPTQAEAFGFVLLCAGLADWLGLSPILSSMVMGSVVGSLATHHTRPFHAIESIEWPFLILFFVLAGASFSFQIDVRYSALIFLYIVARGIGTWTGTYLGGLAVSADRSTRRWMGAALMPQAGVAIGMSLMAAQQLPEFKEAVLAIVLISTVILEVISPVLTRVALRRTHESN